MRVAVVGHVEWVEFVAVSRLPRPGDVTHAQGAFTRAAGGGSVCAAVLAELGAEVDFFTALGDDEPGRAAARELSERGVRVHVAWRSHEPTRRAVTMLESSGERTIVTIGERLDPHGAEPLPWPELAQAQAVYFTAGDGAAFAHARQAPVLTASPRGHAAIEPAAGHPVDALIFSGRDRDESDWARRLADRCRLMVETRGSHGGSWWGESEGSWQAIAPPGPPRDSYGCGDSFAAAFTLALGRGDTVAQAAALGAQWGARCLTRQGAP